jgi:hypothetical protein
MEFNVLQVKQDIHADQGDTHDNIETPDNE